MCEAGRQHPQKTCEKVDIFTSYGLRYKSASFTILDAVHLGVADGDCLWSGRPKSISTSHRGCGKHSVGPAKASRGGEHELFFVIPLEHFQGKCEAHLGDF